MRISLPESGGPKRRSWSRGSGWGSRLLKRRHGLKEVLGHKVYRTKTLHELLVLQIVTASKRLPKGAGNLVSISIKEPFRIAEPLTIGKLHSFPLQLVSFKRSYVCLHSTQNGVHDLLQL